MRIINTLYLADKLCGCPNVGTSLWAGFLKTVLTKMMSGPGEIKASKNRIHPSVFRVFCVN